MNAQALRDLAKYLDELGFLGDDEPTRKAADALRSFASRIDATLTEEVVEIVASANLAVMDRPQRDDHVRLTRAALESIWPVSSEDAKRYPQNLLVDCRRLIEGRAARGNEHARATLKAIDAALAREALREHDSSADDRVYIAITRGDDYADVHPQLVADDFITTPKGFQWEVVAAPSAPNADEPLFTASMYGSAEAATAARAKWRADNNADEVKP
jgi:hypothetical protein